MAKKKAIELRFKNWEEVDLAFKRLAEIEVKKSKIEGDLTIKINELKEKAENAAEALIAEQKDLFEQIDGFANSRKDEFIKPRHKIFNFGKISFSVTQKVKIAKIAASVKALQALGLTECLEIEYKINKEKVKELDANDIAKAGMSIVNEDLIKIEVFKEKIKEVA